MAPIAKPRYSDASLKAALDAAQNKSLSVRESATINKGLITKNQQCRTTNKGLITKNQQCRTINKGLITKNQHGRTFIKELAMNN